MSKLVEKLKGLSEGRAQPMGFAAAMAREKRAPMLLIASLSGTALDSADLDLAGADAVLVTVSDLAKAVGTLGERAKGWGDLPWGVTPKAVTSEGVKQLAGLGCDFIIFDAAQAPASLLQEEDMGKVVLLDPSLPDGLLRALERLPIDAAFIGESTEGSALSVYRLLVYQRLANLVRHPLLAPVPAEPDKGDLEGLLETGVRGVVLEVAGKRSIGRLAEVRRAIDSISSPRKKREKVDALLPRLVESGALPEEGEEEEEE